MDIKELREKAKDAGVKYWHNKKPENLMKELGLSDFKIPLATKKEVKPEVDLNDSKLTAPKLEITINKEDKEYFDRAGLKVEWLSSLANQYNFTRFQYIHKFRAFRCYRGDKHLDWVDLNDLGLLYAKKQLTDIKMKYQPLQKNKKIINLPWSR